MILPPGEREKAARLNVRIIAPDDEEYPDLLRSIHDPPAFLYIKGRLRPGLPTMAFVGSRRATSYGRRITRSFCTEAVRHGAVVVSGMATGIDTEAHRAALAAGGVTWAVWGTGLDRPYPPENAALAEEIVASGGCLISEFPLGSRVYPSNFPKRNRIISGLCWTTVVLEGGIHSGALITARCAAEQGREVFAVPGPVDSPLSEAPYRLLGEGARMARRFAEVWAGMPPQFRAEAPGEPEAPGAMSQLRKKILECLGSTGLSLDELCLGLRLPLPRLVRELTEMELEELVVAVDGQHYAKK